MAPRPEQPASAEPQPAVRIIIIRHGKAYADSRTGRDEDRSLKPRGERQAEWLGSHIAANAPLPGVILHSPLVRAVQTARGLKSALECPLEESDSLAIGEPVANVIRIVERRRALRCIALVGHNPQLEYLAQSLAPELQKTAFVLRTGEAVVIDVAAGEHVTAGVLLDRWRLEEDD